MAKIVTSLALVPGAGATFIATNIGAWTANKGIKTLLIDLSARGVLGPLFLVEKAKEKVYPTTATWQEFSDPASSLIKTQYGLAVLPSAERDKSTDYDLNAEAILNYFDPLFEVIVIDLGGDIYLPHVFSLMKKASKNILVAEPSKRCVEALPGHIKEILMQYEPELIINRVTSRAYYHPRDIARQFNVGQYIAIIDDPKCNNEAVKQRLPLSLYGKGKAAQVLLEFGKHLFPETLRESKDTQEEQDIDVNNVRNLNESEVKGRGIKIDVDREREKEAREGLRKNRVKPIKIPKLLQIQGSLKKKLATKIREKVQEQCRLQEDILITVWNPSGFFVSMTALNLAVAAAAEGYDAALINYNFTNTETDVWFGIKQTRAKDANYNDAGIMTFGEAISPELAVKMLKERAWGVKYLPAGNKLGNIGTPDYGEDGVHLLENIIVAINAREARKPKVTIIEAGTWYEQPPVYAALKTCRVLFIPMSGSHQEGEIVRQQLAELKRVEVEPVTVELIFAPEEIKLPAQVCHERVVVPDDRERYLQASTIKKPYCLTTEDTKEFWRQVVNLISRLKAKKGNGRVWNI
ncbi:hypothetical protein MGLY_27700 [Neomoorella glycerini]|uniref:Uncharacterized protein n=1 Tax=Neomoorella glycerini TaxID=55779 RepID=A0A6I5ZTG8_9FIRM|nr:hypothetical protein [Moorella glycerini]QGP93363.1 hypothetical protein MGLY_27700 [Moorella glycerini]